MVEAAGEAPAEIVVQPGRFDDRLIAYVLDVAPLAALYCALAYYGVFARALRAPRLALAFLAAYVLYQFAGNLAGATIGKRLMGLRVVRRDGRSLGAARSLARALGHLVSMPLFDLGFLLALVHPEGRALHDLLAGSVVVEPRAKSRAEAGALFAAAALTLCGLYALILYINLYRPTPADRSAVARARAGLEVVSRIEDAYFAAHGTYADRLSELAQASGDPAQFKRAMEALFDARKGFRLRAGNRRYRLEAFALDRRRTPVAVEGPPARVF
ncbi:MAG: RDD family protein [Elusimicrobia bacterium]|nr:RDD family protein [Elusimicrobiota bacterium]MDE2237553.1 RDD family protein [Elusimicrobiota bacterium]MDE2425873.1 RDD family protein [Elusimicrobiota bacterium]